MSKRLDLTNQKFGRLTAVKFVKNKVSSWLCRCECGNSTIVYTCHLRSGHTKSCGCLHRDHAIKNVWKMSKINRQYEPMISSARALWSKRYKDGDLKFDDFLKLSTSNCFYCGAEPNFTYNHQIAYSTYNEEESFIYNGLDRVDSSQGHNLDNVVPCCKWCNYAKRERSVEEFKEWVRSVYEHFVVDK